MKRLFDSGELGPAENKNPTQLQRTTYIYLDLFCGRRGRENQRQLTPTILALRKTPQGVEYFKLNRSRLGSLPATKNHQGGLGDSEDDPTLRYFLSLQSASHIQLETPRQSQQGKAERVLVENNFGITSVSNGDKSFRQFFITVMCKCTIITLLDDSNLHSFQTF